MFEVTIEATLFDVVILSHRIGVDWLIFVFGGPCLANCA